MGEDSSPPEERFKERFKSFQPSVGTLSTVSQTGPRQLQIISLWVRDTRPGPKTNKQKFQESCPGYRKIGKEDLASVLPYSPFCPWGSGEGGWRLLATKDGAVGFLAMLVYDLGIRMVSPFKI